MTDDYEYFQNKIPGKTYISKSLSFSSQEDRKIRYASKVFDSKDLHTFVLEKGELLLRVTPGEKQEIVAKFYEDSRGIYALTIQRFTTKTGSPHKTYFTFIGEEISELLEFINNLKVIELKGPEKINITDTQLRKMILSQDQIKNLINHNQDLVIELAKSEITREDLVALGYRKKQLNKFDKLLNDQDYFQKVKRQHEFKKDEAVWQAFFEKNTWIFGYGLSYVFLSSLDDKKLEQVVKGFDFFSAGKRTDALMKTRGLINSLCFCEIKTHKTGLLKKEYRQSCWGVSEELSGAVSQVQGTVSLATKNIAAKTSIVDKSGDPTGEEIYNYHPKSFLVIGSLKEFMAEHGINENKYRSFELFRGNLISPEIITFDELYNRASFIIRNE